jgi:multidrug efflux pump subunit AcrA (membrane-fusion protein)
MTGIVTQIFPIRGQAVKPGEPLFTLRLTHEDLVEKQSQLLRELEELDVVRREVTRLEEVTASGAVAGKQLLERQYEQQKLEAGLRADKQALILHGLSEEDVASIEEHRRLLSEITITAPTPGSHLPEGNHEDFLQVAELSVRQGDHVNVGTTLATLTDHCQLYIEGKAFEQDAPLLHQAADEKAPITALIKANGSGTREVEGLEVLHVENEVERDSRAQKFYVLLPNELVRNQKTEDGNRFIGWRYKPGQRVELLVPIERWERQIVLPVEAVIQEGAESYVYQEIKGHFDRKPVHVVYRDQRHAVVESDGTLFPGDKVAAKGAYQIHLDLKNKSGGGADPHAGHNH